MRACCWKNAENWISRAPLGRPVTISWTNMAFPGRPRAGRLGPGRPGRHPCLCARTPDQLFAWWPRRHPTMVCTSAAGQHDSSAPHSSAGVHSAPPSCARIDPRGLSLNSRLLCARLHLLSTRASPLRAPPSTHDEHNLAAVDASYNSSITWETLWDLCKSRKEHIQLTRSRRNSDERWSIISVSNTRFCMRRGGFHNFL